jgi:hypothetical protein
MADYYPFAPIPFQIHNPDTGALASGFILTAFLENTTTPTPMYSDSVGTSLGTSVTVNAAGYLATAGGVTTNVYISKTIAYKFILKDPETNTEWTVDLVPSLIVSADTPSYDTIAELRAASNGSGFSSVGGHTTVGDGGHGTFYFDADVSSADNDGTIIVDAADPRTGCWKREIEGTRTNFNWFGVFPGAWDVTQANLAVAWAIANGNTLYLPGSTTSYDDVSLSIVPSVNSPLIIEGDGPNATLLNMTAAATSAGDPLFTVDIDSASAADDSSVIFRNIGYDQSVGGNQYSIFSITGDATSSGVTVLFENVATDDVEYLVTNSNSNMKNIILNNVRFKGIESVLNGTDANADIHLMGTNLILEQAPTGNFANLGSSDFISVNLVNVKLSGSGYTLVDFSGSASVSTDYDVSLVNVQNESSNEAGTLVSYVNTGATRGTISLTNCCNNYGVSMGDIVVTKATNLTITNCELDDVAVTTTTKTVITSSDIDAITADATSLLGLAILGTTHDSFTGTNGTVAADADYIGADLVVEGAVTFTNTDAPITVNNATQEWRGIVDSTASTISLPSGWSAATAGGGGNYTVTHTMGTANFGVVAGIFNNEVGGPDLFASISDPTSTTFGVSIVNSSGGEVASDFSFIAWTY